MCTVDGGDLSCVSAEVTDGLHQEKPAVLVSRLSSSHVGEEEAEKEEIVVMVVVEAEQAGRQAV